MIDTHSHLTMDDFDQDREQIVENFEKDGLELAVEIGFDLDSSQKAVEFAETHDKIYASVGIHPHDVVNLENGWQEKVEALLNRKKVMAVGEIGLDYYRDLSPRDLQRKYFELQLEIAKKKNLPVILHVRDAYFDAYEIVRHFDLTAVVHSFNGENEDLKRFLDLGFYIGVGGMATYKKHENLRKILSFSPIERILTETDCPYLSPQPVRGKRNEPKYVRFAVETLSLIFDVPFEKVEKITSENALRFFKITRNA
ncbi:MAG: TatD family hydrolase [Athalassotoga sp.]|uniref:TatD family hydrolase n=1 Tax=Athalassotoga sp. TaxID=2022597 RepID=UPI003D06FC34